MLTRPDYADVWQKRGSSYNKANSLYPQARERERGILIEGLQILPGQTLLDVSSGGGYLPIKVHETFGDSVRIMAIEPSDIFAAALPDYIQRVPGSSATYFNLSNETVDRVSNLSGLHHTENVPLFFSEAHRTLRQGGIVGVAEVREGSRVDQWLNVFVDRHNTDGHKGMFFKEGALSKMAQNAGFSRVSERRVEYTWNFRTVGDMVMFCRVLFGLDLASDEEIHTAIEEILGMTSDTDNQVKIRWELQHLLAVK
jgi:ubiquinone/menaquinone biosynthesis C-methylase UbiE